jgi:hypothetical protein
MSVSCILIYKCFNIVSSLRNCHVYLIRHLKMVKKISLKILMIDKFALRKLNMPINNMHQFLTLFVNGKCLNA